MFSSVVEQYTPRGKVYVSLIQSPTDNILIPTDGTITNERVVTFANGQSVSVRRSSLKQEDRIAKLTNLFFRNNHLSKEHAQIRFDENEGFFIKDTDSTFGTVVNGDKVLIPNIEFPLKNNDKVGFIMSKPSLQIKKTFNKYTENTESLTTIPIEQFGNPPIAIEFTVEINGFVLRFVPIESDASDKNDETRKDLLANESYISSGDKTTEIDDVRKSETDGEEDENEGEEEEEEEDDDEEEVVVVEEEDDDDDDQNDESFVDEADDDIQITDAETVKAMEEPPVEFTENVSKQEELEQNTCGESNTNKEKISKASTFGNDLDVDSKKIVYDETSHAIDQNSNEEEAAAEEEEEDNDNEQIEELIDDEIDWEKKGLPESSVDPPSESEIVYGYDSDQDEANHVFTLSLDEIPNPEYGDIGHASSLDFDEEIEESSNDDSLSEAEYDNRSFGSSQSEEEVEEFDNEASDLPENFCTVLAQGSDSDDYDECEDENTLNGSTSDKGPEFGQIEIDSDFDEEEVDEVDEEEDEDEIQEENENEDEDEVEEEDYDEDEDEIYVYSRDNCRICCAPLCYSIEENDSEEPLITGSKKRSFNEMHDFDDEESSSGSSIEYTLEEIEEPPRKKISTSQSKWKSITKEVGKGLFYVFATLAALGVYGSTLTNEEN